MNYKGIKIIRVPGTRLPKLIFLGKLINQVTFLGGVLFYLLFDFSKRLILLTTNPPFLGILGPILRTIRGKSYIYLVLDVYPDTAEKLGMIKEKSIVSLLWNRINRTILRQASSVVVLGNAMKEIILKKGRKIDSLHNKIHKIHIWSDDRIISPVSKQDNPYISKWDLSGKFTLGYSGNMGRFHDMETIMKAAEKLSSFEDIIFLFIGDGHKKKWMQEFSRIRKLRNCYFKPYVSKNDLRFALACADVGLVSLQSSHAGLSEPSKTFGLLAAGIPVIGVLPRKSENFRILDENNCGVLVEPGDTNGLVKAVLRLYNDPQLRIKMGTNGTEIVKKKYSLNRAAVKYIELLRSI
jgi:glycosyltransferase involved in cell wall biosynthesis